MIEHCRTLTKRVVKIIVRIRYSKKEKKKKATTVYRYLTLIQFSYPSYVPLGNVTVECISTVEHVTHDSNPFSVPLGYITVEYRRFRT